MSDDEYEFIYTSDEDDDDEDLQAENAYYDAKARLNESDPAEIAESFLSVIQLEDDCGCVSKWTVKSRKQLVKLYGKIGDNDKALEQFRALLEHVSTSIVSPSEGEKIISKLFDFVSISGLQDLHMHLFDSVFESQSDTQLLNPKLLFETRLRRANLLFQSKRFRELNAELSILRQEIEKSSSTQRDSLAFRPGALAMQVYALEIQLRTEEKDNARLKKAYLEAKKDTTGVPHPRTQAIIHECGGKMYMQEKLWELAKADFFEAFKNYAEAGDPRRITCLIYTVIANLLVASPVDVLSSPEASPYRTHPEIVTLVSLLEANRNEDILKVEEIVQKNQKMFSEDKFLETHIQELLLNIRKQFLVKAILPYRRIRIKSLCERVHIPNMAVIEDVLVSLILDGKVLGRIDQVEGVLVLDSEQESTEKYRTLASWENELEQIHADIMRGL
eukprot:TRINITY_DN3291_c0_g1_i1.p1 TRINITY_DN3291_c0_g1~~TRINITY_DN3291_c0_g1_i1.p1  ORF type:complete len:446 (+),score=130.49 TRINITY_DN3291_c0_g1_i1:190-1527(+)